MLQVTYNCHPHPANVRSRLKGIENYISNRAIAFSYGCVKYSYGTSINYDMGIGFCLEDDSEKVWELYTC